MTFKTELAADLSSVFYNTDEFAETISYTENGGSPVNISAVLSDVDPAIISDAPPEDSLVVGVRYSEVPDPQKGDVFTINSETYYLVQNLGGEYHEDWQLLVSRSARRRL